MRRLTTWMLAATLILLGAMSGGLIAVRAEGGGSSGEVKGQSDSILVLSGVDLFDGIGSAVRRDVDVIIEGRTIRSICEYGEQDLPASARVLRLDGAYAIPGLIDGHIHITGAAEKSLEIMLRAGIVALRDMGGDGAYLRDLQIAVQQGELQGPDIYFSALVGGPELIYEDDRARLSTPMTYELGSAPWMRVVEDGTDISALVGEAVECGASGIKIYSHISRDIVERICVEAHRQGLKIWAHSFVWPATPEDVVEAGVEVISHAPGLLCKPDWVPGGGGFEFDPEAVDSVRLTRTLSAMKGRDTMLDPTLAVFDIRLARNDTETNLRKRQAMYEVVKRAHAAGIPIVVGTDVPPPCSNGEMQPLYMEMEILVNSVGLTPLEVITAATRNNAVALGIEESHGTLEPGKVADILIIESDPTTSLPSASEVILVIKSGRIVSRRPGGKP
jgi:hypothetical protein